MLDFMSLPGLRGIPEVMKHYESMRARIAQIFLRAEDSIYTVIIFSQLGQAVDCMHT